MNVCRYRKVYVLAPFAGTTGGIELAHQLVDYLRTQGQEAYIVYERNGEISDEQTITEPYRCYNLSTTSTIEDASDNILILPEIFFEFIYRFDNIHFGCWWMSVDNRYLCTQFKEKVRFEKSLWGKIILYKERYINKQHRWYRNDDKILALHGNRITHFYQSRYAQYHLYSKGFTHVLPLSDYINSDLLGDNSVKKQNIVLYNPKKGLAFTQAIMCEMPDVEFIALQGYNRSQLRNLFERAKLYIDFGHFPGKDRLSREAVLNGCCVITGTLGASFFYEDVPLEQGYKFEVKKKNVSSIRCKIRQILENYEEHNLHFNYYRKRVLREKQIFFDEVNEAFFI